jgi:4-amino-4-deoxychorismate lyase
VSQLTCLVNGVRSDGIPVDDRGLHYGDGLFETIAIENGEALCLARHMRRLQSGCKRLGISFPLLQQLVSEVGALAAGQPRAVCKVIVTRGGGRRGYRPVSLNQDPDTSQRMVLLYPGGNAPDGEPVNIRVCETRLGRNSAIAGLKHLNRLEQVLACSEWDDPDIAEGLMMDGEGMVIEATMSNVFGVRGGALLTPDLTHCGVAGIVRDQVLELAQALTGRAAALGEYTLDELLDWDEIFVCNTTREVAPVKRVGEREYAPGPVTEAVRMAVYKLRRPESGQ